MPAMFLVNTIFRKLQNSDAIMSVVGCQHPEAMLKALMVGYGCKVGPYVF